MSISFFNRLFTKNVLPPSDTSKKTLKFFLANYCVKLKIFRYCFPSFFYITGNISQLRRRLIETEHPSQTRNHTKKPYGDNVSTKNFGVSQSLNTKVLCQRIHFDAAIYPLFIKNHNLLSSFPMMWPE